MAKYKFKEDYNAQYGRMDEISVKNFKKGDVIEGGNYPSQQKIVAPTSISTTVDGKMPDWNLDSVWINIPLNVLEEVNSNTPISINNNKGLTNTQKWMVLIGLTAVAYFIIYKVNKTN